MQDAVDPAWSPDGRSVTYYASREGGPSGVMLVDADGRNERVLVSEGASPAWAPSGDEIVYSYSTQGPTYGDLAVIGVNGGGAKTLTDAAGESKRSGRSVSYYNADWSPDGQLIAATRTDSCGRDTVPLCTVNTQLWVMNADGSNPRGFGQGHDPDWSPDGSRIAFWGFPPPSGEPTLGVINRDGSSARYLPIKGSAPAWAPDGTRLVYDRSDRTRPSPSHIYTAALDGTNEVPACTGWDADWQPLPAGETLPAATDRCVAPPSLTPQRPSASARQRRDSRYIRVRVAGRVLSSGASCSRVTVRIRTRVGKRLVRTSTARLQRTCRYARALRVPVRALPRRLRPRTTRLVLRVQTTVGGRESAIKRVRVRR